MYPPPRAFVNTNTSKVSPVGWVEVRNPAPTKSNHHIPPPAIAHPHHPEMGERQFTLGKEVWIERADFNKQPPKGYRRLFPEYVNGAGDTKPAAIVRLKYGYVIECTGYAEDDAGNVTEVHAKVIPDTKSGTPGADSVKAKGVIGWVNCQDGVAAGFRLYEVLQGYAEPAAATTSSHHQQRPAHAV